MKTMKKKRFSLSNVINHVVLSVLSIAVLFPFYYVLIISFADTGVLANSKLYLFPVSLDLTSYKFLFESRAVINGFFVSISVVILGVLFSMAVTVSAAYALSKKTLPFRNVFIGLIVFTMFFGGQLIPYYLTIKNLGLIDNLLVMVIPAGVSTFYLIIIKNYFQTIPASIEESAKIDGANDIRILVSIITPISKPIMATFILFYAVERWNDWWFPMLFISKPYLKPLQTVLRETVSSLDNISSTIGRTYAMNSVVNIQSVRMAMVVLTTIPILLVYPYLQKHFTTGIMLGSIKG